MQPRTVCLRDVADEDLPIFYQHQSDIEAAHMAGFTSREFPAFLAHWAKIRADPGNLLQTIVVDGQTAGNIVSFWMGEDREVGYWLGREYWGQGITSEALQLFLQVDLIRPLWARALKSNVASIRVLEKGGFQYTGQDGEEVILKRA